MPVQLSDQSREDLFVEAEEKRIHRSPPDEELRPSPDIPGFDQQSRRPD